MSGIDLLEDACAKLPHTSRKMFGGHGLFAPNGGMFAGIVDDDRIILKFAKGTPESAAFAAVGGVAWQYKGKMGAMTMAEWLLVPDEMYDEPRTLAEWAAKAHRIAPSKVSKKGGATKAAMPKAPAKRPAAKKAPAKKAPAKKPRKR